MKKKLKYEYFYLKILHDSSFLFKKISTYLTFYLLFLEVNSE